MQNYNNSYLINFKSGLSQTKTPDPKFGSGRNLPQNPPVNNEFQCNIPDYMQAPHLNYNNTYILCPEEIYKILNNTADDNTGTKTESQSTQNSLKPFFRLKGTSSTRKKILKFFGIKPKTSILENVTNFKTAEKTVDYTGSEINVETVTKEACQRGITKLDITEENTALLHKLLQAKDKDKKFRFSTREIIKLSKNKELNRDAVMQLIDLTDADKNPRFVYCDIKELADKNLNSDLMMNLVQTVDNCGRPRFDTCDIVMLSDKELDAKTVMKLANAVDEDGNPRFNAPRLKNLANNKKHNQELVVKLAAMTDADGNPKFENQTISILSSQDLNSKTVMKLVDMTDEEGNLRFTPPEIRVLSNKNLEHDAVIDFVQTFKKITNYYEITLFIKSNGKMLGFLSDKSYMDKIKQHSAGKYQKEVMDLLNPENMLLGQLSSILDTNLSESDYLKSVEKLSKSTFKLAYDKPNRYLSNIDLKYSTPVDGKLPQLPETELQNERRKIVHFFKCNTGQILNALKYVDTDTLSHLMDKRTNQFSESLKDLNEMSEDNLSLLSKLLACKSEKTGKPLSPKEKIQTFQIVKIFDNVKLDTTELENSAKKGVINLSVPKRTILNNILLTAGIDPDNPDIIKDNTRFNEEFSYLVLKNKSDDAEANFDGLRTQFDLIFEGFRINPAARQSVIDAEMNRLLSHKKNMTPAQRQTLARYIEMLSDIENYTNEQIFNTMIDSRKINRNELFTVIKKTVTGDFKEFITDDTNIYGKTNKKTKQIFKKNGLNYDKWLEPDIEDVKINTGGKQMTIKLWDRNPQEDLFIGNKTACCTAIGGSNGEATPSYLLNTSYNVVELYDENDNAVGMSRVFMGRIDDKPALIMDNIELNKTYVKGMTDEQLMVIRNGFFDYMNQYAERVTGDKNAQVRFYAGDIHVPHGDLANEYKVTDFIGAFTSDSKEGENFVYINSLHCSWMDPAKLGKRGAIPWLIVPKNP